LWSKGLIPSDSAHCDTAQEDHDPHGVTAHGFQQIRTVLGTQDGGIKLLLSKALALESVKGKMTSDEVKSAVNELLDVVRALEGINKNVIISYNDTTKE